MTLYNDSETHGQRHADHKYIMKLGSHCSLQVLKGAKFEGFKTLLLYEEKKVYLYKRFKFIVRVIEVYNFK